MTKNASTKLRAGTALQALALCSMGLGVSAVMAAPAAAQDFTTGALVGSVETAEGTRATEGTITITSDAQGFTRTATLNAEGSFRIQSLPVGDYTAVVTVPNFEPVTSSVSV
ncbi:carboxypeptidase-like regulatory domain-containing protein, partial [Sphingomonas sp. IC-56]|uniref:carboxypeptidase-like regulatory domain-containing protein n=1 Tax=Sphingomonas sp. IC-56 TaxID=2898529 RepID=UPI001E587DA8